ncbi:ATP-binding protein [Mycobacterium tuberculosis]|uniref:ATP-binding protein n=1 Tax=Mycobacterium tuberculosis TaxID=1773 RepID=UPI0039E63ABD
MRSALAETTDTARTTGGTGLGLAIVDTLSQRNHASVTARNRAAGGAEISLRLALG